MLWRQGDVFIARVRSIPAEAAVKPRCVLAYGEATGHSHRVDQQGVAQLLEHAGQRFLRVTAASATVVHDEHGPIVLERGLYRVWQQREYTPAEIRTVRD